MLLKIRSMNVSCSIFCVKNLFDSCLYSTRKGRWGTVELGPQSSLLIYSKS